MSASLEADMQVQHSLVRNLEPQSMTESVQQSGDDGAPSNIVHGDLSASTVNASVVTDAQSDSLADSNDEGLNNSQPSNYSEWDWLEWRYVP